MRFAQERETDGAVGRTVDAGARVGRLFIAVGRGERDFDVVFARMREGAHVRDPRAVHIVGAKRLMAVHAHRGERIEAFADEQQRVAGEIVAGQRKIAAIEVVLLHQIKRGQFVVTPEGIVHPAVVQQVGVDGAGDGSAHPLRFVCGAHLPCAVEGYFSVHFFHTFLLFDDFRLQ